MDWAAASRTFVESALPLGALCLFWLLPWLVRRRDKAKVDKLLAAGDSSEILEKCRQQLASIANPDNRTQEDWLFFIANGRAPASVYGRVCTRARSVFLYELLSVCDPEDCAKFFSERIGKTVHARQFAELLRTVHTNESVERPQERHLRL